MYKEYLEIFGLIRFILSLIIAKRYKLKIKYYYLFIIEFFSLFFLSNDNDNFYVLQIISSVILMSSIYGTVNDILFGWFSPDYWREEHCIYNSFPLELSNNDNNPRPFFHSFFWGIFGTWKYALVSAVITFLITFLNPLNLNIIIELYSICFFLMLGISFQQFSILKDDIDHQLIPFYINNYAYQNALFFNSLLLIYLVFIY